MNLVVEKGNLTRDPELTFVGNNNTPKTTLGLAVNRSYKKGDERIKDVDFFRVDVWARQAETCAEYLQKGSPVLIRGELRQDRWETPEGDKRSLVYIVATYVEFLGTRGDPVAYDGPPPDDEAPF